jgi:hypothetical protein
MFFENVIFEFKKMSSNGGQLDGYFRMGEESGGSAQEDWTILSSRVDIIAQHAGECG